MYIKTPFYWFLLFVANSIFQLTLQHQLIIDGRMIIPNDIITLEGKIDGKSQDLVAFKNCKCKESDGIHWSMKNESDETLLCVVKRKNNIIFSQHIGGGTSARSFHLNIPFNEPLYVDVYLTEK
ncbi:hypothetical protein PGT21_028197 [Puccinia graminis f. sp. tritici]|uniref:Uncharacterized protein n=1 Tax=Puccinia graminis f. sp. tritici TaxID=56615 RepID=A0A5B0M7F8_PUCGR|nr:hypothetical protein PGT21_028197 [Puccinia graminis f. sp. tritici]KAA1135227.1 hypothetical protein PGTUg99_018899 [Puccinia graminis f. sp. tritici]